MSKKVVPSTNWIEAYRASDRYAEGLTILVGNTETKSKGWTLLGFDPRSETALERVAAIIEKYGRKHVLISKGFTLKTPIPPAKNKRAIAKAWLVVKAPLKA